MTRKRVVEAGAIPVLVELLDSSDTDVQHHCVTALINVAVDGKDIVFDFTSLGGAYPALGANRKELARSKPNLVQLLVQLLDSASLKIQCQVVLALRNLTNDGEYQVTLSGCLVHLSLQKTISWELSGLAV